MTEPQNLIERIREAMWHVRRRDYGYQAGSPRSIRDVLQERPWPW
jgi:hypothetical protein